MDTQTNKPKRSKRGGNPEPAEPAPSFESSLEELEALVERMEGGDLSLDESLKAFERGILLSRQCHEALQQAQLRVQTLTSDGTLAELELDELVDD